MRCTAAHDLGVRWRRAAAAPTSRTSSRMRAGRSESTRTRSASCAASSMSWVTSTTVRGCSRSSRASSRAHAQAGQVVERRERLVHQQEVGVAGQGARQLDALPHAARELVRVVPLEAGEADQVEQRLRAPASRSAASRDVAEAEADVLAHGPPGEEAVLLEDHAHALGPLDASRAAAASQPEARLSSVVLPQPDGPTTRHELAVAHLEMEVPQHLDVAEGDARAVHAQQDLPRPPAHRS